MAFIHFLALLAVLQYLYFGVLVGRARLRYHVKAPAVTGDENFERAYRVQMNTLEQLIIFLPALLIARASGSRRWALPTWWDACCTAVPTCGILRHADRASSLPWSPTSCCCSPGCSPSCSDCIGSRSSFCISCRSVSSSGFSVVSSLSP